MQLLVLSLVLLVHNVRGDMYDADSYDGVYDTPATEYGANVTYDGAIDAFSYGGDSTAAGSELEGTNNYYGDDLDEYYEQSGVYGDMYGDDYFFDDLTGSASDCTEDATGKANVTAPACDVTISGVDKVGDQLEGGIDGVYHVSGCWDGKPKYVRQKKGSRVLYFSNIFKDWDICLGAEVNESALVIYGGGEVEYTRPNFVPSDKWHLAGMYMSDRSNGDTLSEYSAINMTVDCKSGEQIEAPKPDATAVTQSLLTDEEEDAKYRAIYTQARAQSQPEPSINFALVICMILAGMGVVLGLPYLLFKKKDGQSKSWLQQLEDSRKRRGGHVL